MTSATNDSTNNDGRQPNCNYCPTSIDKNCGFVF
ncbi:unnamed protein product, partial [Vitis vinifera]|uniref:Uncharacterized protein n=1 Tax=Vitis vinifera TaxID=29760 RepID=D7TAT9_VITVI